MANDCLPRRDAAFHGWQANFVSYANANLLALGLTPADMTPILAAQTAWTSGYPAHIAAQAAAQAARDAAARPQVVGVPRGEGPLLQQRHQRPLLRPVEPGLGAPGGAWP